MSDGSQPPPGTATPARSFRRQWLLAVAALGFAAAGGGWAVWWDRVGRFRVATDDAYVAGNVVPVMPQVAGTVVRILADDTDFVQAGQALVEIDDTDARLALDLAKAELAQTVREVRTLFSTDGALAASVAVQRGKPCARAAGPRPPSGAGRHRRRLGRGIAACARCPAGDRGATRQRAQADGSEPRADRQRHPRQPSARAARGGATARGVACVAALHGPGARFRAGGAAQHPGRPAHRDRG